MRFLLLALLACSSLPFAATPASCGPVLNEVMADPARDWDGDATYNYRDDEWVELYNPGPGAVDLTGIVIGDEDQERVIALDGALPEGGHRVIFGSEAAAFQAEHGWGVTGMRLGNDGDTVTLLQVVGPDTLLIDSYTYLTHEAEDDRSSGRRPDGGAAWELFDSLNPYTGGTDPLGNGLPPTPGSPNGEDPVAVILTTWGRVRAIFD